MKKRIIFIDILTTILLIIQIQSTITFVTEVFVYLKNFSWDDFFYMYITSGIAHAIVASSFEKLYFGIVFIVFFLNLYAIAVKLKDIRKQELIKGIYRGFIAFNLIFVVLKVLEFCIIAVIKMHA